MNRFEGLPSAEGEEARLLKILADCMEAVTAARRALHEPSYSLLAPEYTKLANDLEMARAEREKAEVALREYRRGRAQKKPA
jgi:hypothetical protein